MKKIMKKNYVVYADYGGADHESGIGAGGSVTGGCDGRRKAAGSIRGTGDTSDSGKVPAAKDGQTDKVEKPTAVPEPATYKAEQIIELACSTQNAVIYYTTDGTTEPSNNTADPNIKQYDPAQKFKSDGKHRSGPCCSCNDYG